jgi:hypothetical protein
MNDATHGKAAAGDRVHSASAIGVAIAALAFASGFYEVVCVGADGREKWRDTIENQWASEGAEAVLTHALKASALTQTVYLGLIESAGFTAYARTNTMASLTAVGGGSPANGWNEAQSSMYSARLAPSFGTASTAAANSDLATSSTVDITINATCTIKGCFVAIKNKAGTAPTSAVGNTAGALLSMGNFTQGDKACSATDTLKVTYTARLTT